MRIRLDDAGLVPDLLAYLGHRADLVTERLGEHELEVGVLGSFGDGGRTELERYLASWLQAHPAAVLEFVPDEATHVVPSAEELAETLFGRLERAEGSGDERSLGIA